MAGTGRKIVSGLLSGILAFIFISTALVKLTPNISKEVHLKFYKEYQRFSKIHPAAKLGYQIDPLKFMPQIGVIQLVCGVLLIIGPRITKLMSCLLLSSIVVGVLYFKYVLKDPMEELAVFGVILLALFVRLNMFASPIGTDKEKKEDKTKEKKEKKKEAKKDK